MPFTPLKMKAPAGVSGIIQGLAQTYTQNSDGTYTIADYRDVSALLAQGWAVDITRLGGNNWVAALTSILPSATLATYGTAKNLTPDSGSAFMTPLSLDLVWGGTFNSETTTAQLIPTYSDGTTGTPVTSTATATGTTAFTNAQLRSLFKDGVSIASIAINCKSTINSSAVTLAVNAHGLNQ